MTVRHTPGRRDLYKSATAVLTGLAAFGSLAGTGYAAGAVAHQQDLSEKEKQQSPAPAATLGVPTAPVTPVARRRPHRTVVRTEVVHRVSTNVTTVGGGGTISSTAPSGSGNGSSASSSSGGGSHPAPRPPAQAPAPAPKPAPAPSSGS